MEPQSGDRCAHSGKKAADAGDHEDHEATLYRSIQNETTKLQLQVSCNCLSCTRLYMCTQVNLYGVLGHKR
jgi:hypothetical protein